MQETTKDNKVFTTQCSSGPHPPSSLGSRTPELYCMSCLDEEQHNLGVIRFCFMLIYVIFKCKCTEIIGSGAAWDENRWEKFCLDGCKQKTTINKMMFPCQRTKNKYLPFVSFLFHTMVSLFLGYNWSFCWPDHNWTDMHTLSHNHSLCPSRKSSWRIWDDPAIRERRL